jgi:hypothetical protein
LSSPLWLLAVAPILPPLVFFAYATWEPGCVSSDGGAVDVFQLGAGITVALQVAAVIYLAVRTRDRAAIGALLATVVTVVLFVGGWGISTAVADAVTDGPTTTSC